ncbi:MAG: DNA mismatch repair protein MutS [Chloroflexi bacterium]|nr:DNA mismatch repair protein MutS [Chloroflexota bacterium]
MTQPSPARKQYLQIKKRYPEAILFFRMGDFYETFDEDAKVASRELEIVLTSRGTEGGKPIPLAGIPYHAAESYIAKLIGRGYKVALCEQTSDPAASKGIVDRDVVRVVTPGTIVEPQLLDAKANNYLVAAVAEKETAGLAYVDITTAEFATTQLPLRGLQTELERLQPTEVLLPRNSPLAEGGVGFPTTQFEPRHFDLDTAREALKSHFQVATLEAFGCSGLPQAVRAAGAIVQYLAETQKGALSQLSRLSTYSTDSFMVLDPQTRRNLELVQTSRAGTTQGSLLSVIDLTKTSMGGRLLRRWLNQPLLDRRRLEARQCVIQEFVADNALRAEIISLVDRLSDLERLVNRVSAGIALPRELVSLRKSLEIVPDVRRILGDRVEGRGYRVEEGSAPLPSTLYPQPFVSLLVQLKPCDDIVALIRAALVDEPPASMADGGFVRPGFSDELDSLTAASRNARQYIAGLERTERERTGIKSLKVGYNKVFGYYLEVSNSNLEAPLPLTVRDRPEAEGCATLRDYLEKALGYLRRQTLVGGERYITPELKEYESLILNAQEKLVELERSVFGQICQQVAAASDRILSSASALAHLDAFAALGEVAVRNRYVRPMLTEGDEIRVVAGRHPVVERTASEEGFVANDVRLSGAEAQIVILTGPNMAGKSTYLRQVALIVLLAQIGSFVPADAANIGLVDRIFTRVGAQDDLATGQSTFMVEMVETANILNHATSRSLIVLDEIGRGTSTYDGLSIARAVVEHIHNHPRLGAKTLFATHYHELTELADVLPRVRNFNVAVAEENGKVAFLRKIVPGGADRSYGIHVAQMAGLPRSVIRRAEEILRRLEESPKERQNHASRHMVETAQLSFFQETHPAVKEIESLDVDSMTPLEAITKLYELKLKAKEPDGKSLGG